MLIEEGPCGIWMLTKCARNRSGIYKRGLAPTLRARDGPTVEIVKPKAAVFQQASFPQLPEVGMVDTEGYIYIR